MLIIVASSHHFSSEIMKQHKHILYTIMQFTCVIALVIKHIHGEKEDYSFPPEFIFLYPKSLVNKLIKLCSLIY